MMETRKDPIQQFIGYSLIAHLALLVALILRGTILAPPPKEYVPSLRVDLVAMPDLKKTDVPVIKEEKVEKPVEKPAEKPAEAKLEEVKPAEDGEIALKKKKEKSAREKAAQEKLKNALARIKALERIKMMAGTQIKGNQISKGSALSGDAKTALETTYFDVVLERVRNYWELPKWLQDQAHLSAQVTIFINREGKMTRYVFNRTSGNESFDNEIKRTLQSAVPFPAPPIAIIPDLANEGIVLGFPM